MGWGFNGHGQLNIPVPNADFVAVAAGYNSSLGLKTPPPPPLTGACCVSAGCISGSTEVQCLGAGGIYQGDGTTCATVSCPEPPVTGACCVGDGCLVETESNYTAVGGTYQGDNSSCEKVTCPTICSEDINGDGVVDVTDLLQLIGAWGTCLP